VTLEFRALRSAQDLALLPPFEVEIWGTDEPVATHMLVATVNEGGMAIGAFDQGRLVGSVYGFATHEPHVLHSHYMAVHPDYRRQGLGRQLKYAQRDWCLANGRTAMRWTYDPLQLGNAHLNLRVLGARGVAYHVDYYGPMEGINGGLPSDRLMVHWNLRGDDPTLGEQRSVVVPPTTSDEIATASPNALSARAALRAELAELVASGWVVVDVDREMRRYTVAR
jgi:predicted GNAT superfamily acetyltransferase